MRSFARESKYRFWRAFQEPASGCSAL
jgi:hypothetical protein